MFQNILSDYNLSDDDSTSHGIGSHSQGDGPRKKRTQNENCKMWASISVEPLMQKGVPRSLCDLVANMLDCALMALFGKMRHTMICLR